MPVYRLCSWHRSVSSWAETPPEKRSWRGGGRHLSPWSPGALRAHPLQMEVVRATAGQPFPEQTPWGGPSPS